jgi:nucleotide-binding universal stress UspA family protein
MEAAGNGRVIVVGVDGSDEARRALDWSIDEARLRGAAIRVVSAWHVPLAGFAGHGATVPAGLSLEDALRQAAEGVASASAKHVSSAEGIQVETRVVEGRPAEVLIREAGAAELLVLGAPRPSGASRGLSSVGVQCALNAPAPTVVIR